MIDEPNTDGLVRLRDVAVLQREGVAVGYARLAQEPADLVPRLAASPRAAVRKRSVRTGEDVMRRTIGASSLGCGHTLAGRRGPVKIGQAALSSSPKSLAALLQCTASRSAGVRSSAARRAIDSPSGNHTGG